jgi:phage gp29-like protein
MNLFQRIVNAVRPTAPRPGRILLPRKEDSIRDYPGAGLTPSRLAAILRDADGGSPAAAMQLFEEMEEKDAHLFAVANTRRLALTGLDWSVVSAADVREGVDRAAADEAAAHCRDVLAGLEGFEEALQHLALAIGRNIAIAEIVWESSGDGVRPAQVVPVDFTRIVFDEFDRPRLLTDDAPRDGIALSPGKFIVHAPHSVSGHPQRGGLLRVTAMVQLAKSLALKDWMIFAEIFGMPVRIGRYDPAATPEEKRELIRMLETLGSHAVGVGTMGPPYERLVEFLNREMSKAWLGQTLTTDISGQRGSLTAAQTHETVRQDLRADDVRKEGRTIRRDLLTPIVRLRFGDAAPVPYFRRDLLRPTDAGRAAAILDAAINRLGLEVPTGWARQMLGIPAPATGEDVIRPSRPGPLSKGGNNE